MSRSSGLRIGCSSAAWGDSVENVRQLVEQAELDYLVGDYLAEVSMALLARSRQRGRDGFVPDWLASVEPVLDSIHAKGIKLVTNAGGLDPRACGDAFEKAAADRGIQFRVAVVTGDDLMPPLNEVGANGPEGMPAWAALPGKLESMNAYLGAAPIVEALRNGADVVITGRIVDSALVLAPLVHEFGWDWDDYDLLSAGSLAGHVIECGAQATGGLFTDWKQVEAGWPDMGLPVVECMADGEFRVGKPPNTGGLIGAAGVAEQILYEIGDPARYELPDVCCDWREVRLSELSDGRVGICGARGVAPSGKYKVCAVHSDGYRLISSFMVAGGDASRRGRRAAEALVERVTRIAGESGCLPFEEVSIEVIGAEESYGSNRRIEESREVIVKIGLRHSDRQALEIFAREFAVPAVSMAQGITGLFGGRPAPTPAMRVSSFLAPAEAVEVRMEIGGRSIAIAPNPDRPSARPIRSIKPIGEAKDTGSREIALRDLAWARSGDKGNDANIGVIARRSSFAPSIKRQLTAERVAEYFDHYVQGRVTRFELPGLSAFNFLLEDSLGGGGTASLRYDPQGKALAQLLLDMPMSVPAGLLGEAADAV